MSTFNKISAKALLAAAAMTCSPAAWSLGLGDAQVESFLDQPLKAKIDLVTREGEDLASVNASLASADDYELIGVSLQDMPVPVRFTIEDADGDAYLMATSNLPVSTPIVRLIVEVSWASGRMLREYTLFLDPPAVPDQAPPPRIEQRRNPPAATAPAAVEPAMEETPAAGETAAPAQTAEPRRVPQAGEYGPVASGETLWRIASEWSRGTGLSVNQVMIAIQRDNPQAFLKDNINLLKRGAILRMPEIAEVEQIPAAVATSEVAAQEEEFTGARPSSLAASPEMPLLSDQSAAPPAAEAVAESVEVLEEDSVDVEIDSTQALAEAEATAEEEIAEEESAEIAAELADEAAAAADGGMLELVPPSEASELDSTYGFEETEDSGDATTAQALRESLARTEEDLITEQQQNAYLEERIKELEAQLEEAEESSVADSDMANMEQRLREERQASSPPADEPWYSRYGAWLIGLLLAVAAFVGWRLSRRGDEEIIATAGSNEALQDITEEAEQVLRVLEDSDEPSGDEAHAEGGSAADGGDKPKAVDSEEADAGKAEGDEPKKEKPKRSFGDSDDDAEVLDVESSDPEIQLDLARAYISMGDREAARVILEEVISNGSEEQQAEARKMLDLM
jgi:pilus assembly protein FimV